MKGVVFTGNRKIEIQDFADPVPGDDDVVLEIKASGMCGTDLHLYRSPGGGPAAAKAMGVAVGEGAFIGGHEPCGVVVARGKSVTDRHAKIGARVMQHHYQGCGGCPDCMSGWTQMCKGAERIVYGYNGHGAHARYMACPAHTLIAMPDGMSFEVGAAVSCGTGTAFTALRRMKMDGGGTLVVSGQGPVGTSGTMLGKAMGMRVIAVDIADERLKLAKTCGADHVVNSAKGDVVDAVKSLTGGRGADYVLETSGNPDARVAGVRATKTFGSLCFVGEGGAVTLDVSNDIIRRQITMYGSWTFSKNGQDDCARFIAEHGVPIEKLITHRFKLKDAVNAYAQFDKQTMGKGMIIPS
jgi:threonine dehydrogenase-like Zn-dependent dehydrogenase